MVPSIFVRNTDDYNGSSSSVGGVAQLMNAASWIRALGLKKHPEGGYFRENFRSNTIVEAHGFDGWRNACTAIYYLLKSGQFSAFHRIKSDELWHFYAGSPLIIHTIDRGGRYRKIRMGKGKNLSLQAVVEAGHWFSASVDRPKSYSLVGCTVAPGFDFKDWEVAKASKLLALYPQHQRLIEKLTRK